MQFSMSKQHNQALWPNVVFVLLRPQAREVCARNRLHKTIPDGLIPNRVIDYTPRMVTQENVFRINCVMIPDSMVQECNRNPLGLHLHSGDYTYTLK